MKKRIIFGGFFTFLIIILVCWGNLSAYSTGFTHPHLSREIVEFYSSFDSKYSFSNEEINWLIKGSREEDTPPRYINHFYDPINNQPWLGDNPVALTSKEWANNSRVQSSYFGGDQSFDRAIYEYRAGNKKAAFIALGHILHLIQDASVPEHTRSDTHIPGLTTESPYEVWTEKYNQTHSDPIAQNLINNNKELSSCFSLDNCFDEVASYSNGYFFSIDSINDYKKPNIVSTGFEDGVLYGYGQDIDRSVFRLVSMGSKTWRNFSELTSYELDDNVLSDYWTRLSVRSVQTGARIIKIFFDEIEYQERNSIPNREPLSWWKDWKHKIRTFFGFIPTSVATKEVVISSGSKKPAETPPEIGQHADVAYVSEGQSYGDEELPDALPSLEPILPSVMGETLVALPNSEITPPAVPIESSALDTEDVEEGIDTRFYISALPLPLENHDYVAPVLPIDGVGGPDSLDSMEEDIGGGLTVSDMVERYGYGFGGVQTGNGDEEEGVQDEEEMVEEGGAAEDEDDEILEGEIEEVIEEEAEEDETEEEGMGGEEDVGDEGDEVAEEEDEVEENEVEEPVDDAEEDIEDDEEEIQDEEEGGEEEIQDGENEEEEAEEIIVTPALHIVIFEIQTRGEGGAWDESVKVRNSGATSTSLFGLKLQSRGAATSTINWISRSGDGLPDININASGTVLLASKNYSGADEAWRHTARWGLADDGGGVRLLNTEDEVVAEKYWGTLVNVIDEEDGGAEDVDDEVAEEEGEVEEGDEAEEPVDDAEEDEEVVEDEGAEGGDDEEPEDVEEPVPAGPTPLAGKITSGTLTLVPELSPYLVSAEFFVDKNATLVVEPGVVIKFGKKFQSTWMKFPTHLRIAGSLYINGTEEDPVIFTSIADDSFGGDANENGAETVPNLSDWGHLVIESEADEEINIFHTHFYYGGNNTGSNGNGAVLVSRGGVEVNVQDCYFANNPVAISNFGWKNTESKPINITNTLIENNKSGVILDVYAPLSIINSTIRDNFNYGIYLEAYSEDVLNLENNNIYGNGKYGLWNFYGWSLKNKGLALSEVLVQNNWWGDATGPSPEGLGDKVGDKVNYSNWLLEKVTR